MLRQIPDHDRNMWLAGMHRPNHVYHLHRGTAGHLRDVRTTDQCRLLHEYLHYHRRRVNDLPDWWRAVHRLGTGLRFSSPGSTDVSIQQLFGSVRAREAQQPELIPTGRERAHKGQGGRVQTR